MPSQLDAEPQETLSGVLPARGVPPDKDPINVAPLPPAAGCRDATPPCMALGTH